MFAMWKGPSLQLTFLITCAMHVEINVGSRELKEAWVNSSNSSLERLRLCAWRMGLTTKLTFQNTWGDVLCCPWVLCSPDPMSDTDLGPSSGSRSSEVLCCIQSSPPEGKWEFPKTQEVHTLSQCRVPRML